tara:strand:+ start:473 stop:580 length:108 start_codon:yes stop_codon:yes gene_type:complete
MKNPWIHKNGQSKLDKRAKQHQSQAKKNAIRKKSK